MYVNRVSLYENNLHNTMPLQSFKGSLGKTVLTGNNIPNTSLSKTEKFVHKLIDFFENLLNPNKKIKQIQEIDSPIKSIKLSEAKIREMLNIPENGFIIRDGYEEHYKNGKIVKKILRPEAYAEHTKIVDSRVDYVYDGDVLKEIHKFYTINGVEVMAKRVYTNLGDISVAQIRDL